MLRQKAGRVFLMIFFLTLLFSVTAFAQDKDITITVEDEGIVYDKVFTIYGIEGLNQTEAKSNSLSIAWDRNPLYGSYLVDEVGYEISYYQPDKKEYRHVRYIKDLKSTETTLKFTGNSDNGSALKAGKRYTYAVREYFKIGKKYYYGYYTKIRCVTRPKASSLKSLSNPESGILSVKWKKLAGCDGYAIKFGTDPSLDTLYGSTDIKYFKDADTTVKSLKKLPAATFYVKLAPYMKNSTGKKILGPWSERMSIKLTKGVSLKAMINAIDTKKNKNADIIKDFTDGDVRIKKYDTTYDKFMAIYRWHAKHAKDFYDEYSCNSNFNECIMSLLGYQDAADYHRIWLNSGYFVNKSGSKSSHKWSVIYFGCKAYGFDPRIEGKIDKKGSSFFGFTEDSDVYRNRYVFKEHDVMW